jgi:hypothetical protein
MDDIFRIFMLLFAVVLLKEGEGEGEEKEGWRE